MDTKTFSGNTEKTNFTSIDKEYTIECTSKRNRVENCEIKFKWKVMGVTAFYIGQDCHLSLSHVLCHILLCIYLCEVIIYVNNYLSQVSVLRNAIRCSGQCDRLQILRYNEAYNEVM